MLLIECLSTPRLPDESGKPFANTLLNATDKEPAALRLIQRTLPLQGIDLFRHAVFMTWGSSQGLLDGEVTDFQHVFH